MVQSFTVGLAQLAPLLKHRPKVLLIGHDYPTLHAPFALPGFQRVVVPPEADGTISLDTLRAALERERPQLVAISEVQWRAFLDKEVTPRFPDGLTVFDAYGQWLFRGNAGPVRLDSKVLVILHEDTPRRTADIEAIRLAWKQATKHQSVLWSKQAAEVSF